MTEPSGFRLEDADRDAVERQLGRPLRGHVRVAVRCGCGLPAVIETYPVVDSHPFPTLYWLTCRRASSAVGGLEASGVMTEVNDRIRADPDFAADLERAQHDYVARRDAHHRLEGAGGVGGGPPLRVKCLHAHLAHHLACDCNPVGAWVADRIGELLRPPPCV